MYSKSLLFFFFCNLCFSLILINASNKDDRRKSYIVYMGELPENTISLADVHHNLLLETIGNEEIARESKIYSYGRSFNAFAAKLLPHEAKKLSQHEKVFSVFPSGKKELRTTRSWDFLGMPLNVTRNPSGENDVIVALLDTGIYIPSPSFNDTDFGPPPAKWKGKCDTGPNFTGCNNKVIGARYFNLVGAAPPEEVISPADYEGHGTHTSSTAAGIPVANASYHGIANGTARGGAPLSRIASYKVCWSISCTDEDILAGFDEAIGDGVDIISVSLGGMSTSYFDDSVAIGAFHAMKKGILVVCAGGNDGPSLSTIQNTAPWIITVAATTTDRNLETIVELGDGRNFSGSSVDIYPMKEMYTLLNGARATNGTTDPFTDISSCDPGTLDPSKVKGNIIFCQGPFGQDKYIKSLGGVGTVMTSTQNLDTPMPTDNTASTFVNIYNGNVIDTYINSTQDSKAIIHKTRTTYNATNAPRVASFSSRGPQTISTNILKPDISAPGVSILAAFTRLAAPNGDPKNQQRETFYIESGTSMATPHVAGAAAYVKSFHPHWSPSAIKSALMTTAKPFKAKEPGAQLAYGSGELNPTGAVHPGLVYDLNLESYISLLCKEGYNNSDIAKLMGKKVSCSSYKPAEGTDGINYPSMHIQVNNTAEISAVFYRTVTFVGQGKALFKAIIHTPKTLSITVSPNTLAFTKPYQQKSFTVTLNGTFVRKNSWYLSASLIWSDLRHSVRSPILVYRQPQ